MNLTILAKLKAQSTNCFGYTTYIFEITESEIKGQFGTKYFACTRFPNWECRELHNEECGYVELQENLAGKSTWWDGTQFIPYKYDSLQFVSFTTPTQQDNINEIKL